MTIWDKVRDSIDKAGKAAQDAFDEGKLRLDLFKAREQADKAAQALGYAVFRAKESGHALDPTAEEQLRAALRDRESLVTRLEREIEVQKGRVPEPQAGSAPGGSPSTTDPSSESTSTGSSSAGSSSPGDPPATDASTAGTQG